MVSQNILKDRIIKGEWQYLYTFRGLNHIKIRTTRSDCSFKYIGRSGGEHHPFIIMFIIFIVICVFNEPKITDSLREKEYNQGTVFGFLWGLRGRSPR